jgi:hypothetical protein
MFQSVSLITSLLTTLGVSHALEQGTHASPTEVRQNHQTDGRQVARHWATRGQSHGCYGPSTPKTDGRMLRPELPVLRKPLGDGGTSFSPCSFRITEPTRCSRGACESLRAIEGVVESIPQSPRCGSRVSSRERKAERSHRVEVLPQRIRNTRWRGGVGLAIRIERNLEVEHQIRTVGHRIRKIGHRGSRRLRDRH